MQKSEKNGRFIWNVRSNIAHLYQNERSKTKS